jgi:hypothetical protein
MEASEQQVSVQIAKDAPGHARQACHNCRRQRLKCDRSIPGCAKCDKRQQECLGYGQLFRWQEGIVSRGKMTGLTHAKRVVGGDACLHAWTLTQVSPRKPNAVEYRSFLENVLTDPLVQNLDRTSRSYLSYCESFVPQRREASD